MAVNDLARYLPIAAFIIFLGLQFLLPRRDLSIHGATRWMHNVFLFLTNALITRFLVPLSLLSVAAWAEVHSIGLFNWWAAPVAVAVMVSVVVQDFALYWQHVATHKWSVLWRLHKVHHADLDMDVTTALRFHPIELFLSLLYKSLVVMVLGAPLAAVVVFELVLFLGASFNHSNIRLPEKLDTILRYVIATPDVHRSHHSVYKQEQDTNYGFFLIWWDRLFATYTHRPADGHQTMRIGLADQSVRMQRVDQMLLAPFRN